MKTLRILSVSTLLILGASLLSSGATFADGEDCGKMIFEVLDKAPSRHDDARRSLLERVEEIVIPGAST